MTNLGIFSEKTEEFVPAAEVYGRLREMDDTDPEGAKIMRDRLLAGKVIVIVNEFHAPEYGISKNEEE